MLLVPNSASGGRGVAECSEVCHTGNSLNSAGGGRGVQPQNNPNPKWNFEVKLGFFSLII